MKNVVEAIKKLYPQLPSGDYLAEFPDDINAARRFAVAIRDQLVELGVPQTETWDIVEQRNTNVYMRMWAVDVSEYEKFRSNDKEEEVVTSEKCMSEDVLEKD